MFVFQNARYRTILNLSTNDEIKKNASLYMASLRQNNFLVRWKSKAFLCLQRTDTFSYKTTGSVVPWYKELKKKRVVWPEQL